MKKTKMIASLMLALAILATPLTLMSKTTSDSKKTIVLTADNTIVLNDEVNGETVGKVIAEARALDEKASYFGLVSNKEPIYLFLYTPGGSIQAGLELETALKGLRRPVHTITLFAASMGFQLAQGLGDRLIVEKGTLMSHRAYGGFEGEFGGKNPSQMGSRMKFWEERLTEMDRTTVKRTNGKQTLESYQDAYANELWITGSQAVEQGYADRLVNVRCDSSLSGVTTHQIEFFGMSISYDLDNCPINTSPMNIRQNIPTTGGEELPMEDFTKKGGGFGTTCIREQVTNPAKVCALDMTLTPEKLKEAKMKVKDSIHPSKRIGQKAAEGLYW